MTTSTGLRATQFLFREFVFEVITWPLWWYSRGAMAATRSIFGWWQRIGQRTNLALHIRNIFTPMYGENSWQGRLISFFMRLILIGARLVVVILGAVAALAALVAWLVIPLVAVGMVLRQFFPA